MMNKKKVSWQMKIVTESKENKGRIENGQIIKLQFVFKSVWLLCKQMLTYPSVYVLYLLTLSVAVSSSGTAS